VSPLGHGISVKSPSGAEFSRSVALVSRMSRSNTASAEPAPKMPAEMTFTSFQNEGQRWVAWGVRCPRTGRSAPVEKHPRADPHLASAVEHGSQQPPAHVKVHPTQVLPPPHVLHVKQVGSNWVGPHRTSVTRPSTDEIPRSVLIVSRMSRSNTSSTGSTPTVPVEMICPLSMQPDNSDGFGFATNHPLPNLYMRSHDARHYRPVASTVTLRVTPCCPFPTLPETAIYPSCCALFRNMSMFRAERHPLRKPG
jgi:hypothetical protein